jgi:mRNA interferase HigB
VPLAGKDTEPSVGQRLRDGSRPITQERRILMARRRREGSSAACSPIARATRLRRVGTGNAQETTGIERRADAASSLRLWWDTVQAAEWHNFSEVRQTYSTVSYVDPYTVFNIRGNDYRLVTWIDYEGGIVVMKWFCTHAEYDKEQWK